MSTKRPKRAFTFLQTYARSANWMWSFWAIAGLGITLRCVYTIFTPYDVRSHDVDGHIEYIQYVANTLHIPPATGGWEYYQPPLYYFLIGIFYKFWSLFDVSTAQLMRFMQFDSLLLSFGTMAAGMWMAKLTFGTVKYRKDFYIYCLLIATFPGLIYVSARINNDVLYTFFAFLFLALLIEWWKDNRKKYWYILQFVIATGILTKSNSLLFLPIAFACLLIHPKWKIKQKILHGFFGIMIITLIAGWYPAYRYAVDKLPYDPVKITGSRSATLIPNLTNLHSGLRLQNAWQGYVVFNPFEVLKIPYNNAWEDSSRREYFWEYMLRSSITGEFNMGEQLKWTVTQLLFICMVFLALALFGILRAFFALKETMPFLIALLIILAGHIALRFSSPFSAIQDFRYSPLLLPLFGYFAIYGQRFLPSFSRKIATYLWGVFFFLTVMYIIAICAYGVR